MKRPTKSRAPYYKSEKSVENTVSDITNLLQKYEAIGWRWTTMGERFVLEFILDIAEEGGEARPMEFRVEAPRQEYLSPRQAMRLLHWWMKSKLEAIAWGLSSAVEEFLPYVVGQLPSGEPVTVGEIIVPRIVQGQLGAGDLIRALPGEKEEKDEN